MRTLLKCMPKNSLCWFSILSSLFILALSFYIQFTTPINLDSANTIHESILLFSGGKFFTDFFETTPPMFLYVNFPVSFILMHFKNANMFIVFSIYYTLLSVSMLSICYALSKKLFSASDKIKMLLFMLASSAVFLDIGALYFGQREHTALIFTLPYFLLLALRLEKIPVNEKFCLFVGILGGIGFSIKPHFCLPFILSELYFYIKTREIKTWIRNENIIIVSIFVVYLISTYLLYPDYFHYIVPLSAQFYYQGISTEFHRAFFQAKMLFSYITIIFYFLIKREGREDTLINVMLIGMIGYILSYISQIVSWDYHMFPAFCFTILLNMLLLCNLSNLQNVSRKNTIIYILFAYLVYEFDIFCFAFHSYLLIALSTFSLSWYLGMHIYKNFIKIIAIASLSILIFTSAVYPPYLVYRYSISIGKMMLPIENFLHQYSYRKRVYFLTGVLGFEYPAVDYAGAIHSSKFPYLLWLTAFLKAYQEDPNSAETLRLEKLNNYFLTLVGDDINIKKPEFILVDSSKNKSTAKKEQNSFDYLPFFLKNPEFRSAFKNYSYFGVIKNEPHYTFIIYKRKDNYESFDQVNNFFCGQLCPNYIASIHNPFTNSEIEKFTYYTKKINYTLQSIGFNLNNVNDRPS